MTFAEEMKTILIALFAIIATGVYADQRIVHISVYTGTWLVDFRPGGRATASYGSIPGDSGFVDDDTVDFIALLESILKTGKKDTKELGDRFQVSIGYVGETTSTAYSLVDDTFIYDLLEDLDGKWKPHPVGQRFYELKSKYPIVPTEKENSEQGVPGYRRQGAPQPEP